MTNQNLNNEKKLELIEQRIIELLSENKQLKEENEKLRKTASPIAPQSIIFE